MNIVTKFLASIALVIIAVVGFVYSGIFNVSTQWEDPEWLKWMLIATREASVEARADDIQPPLLGGATQIANGFRSYREMCAICHTPPGESDSPITQGLNPSPPDLTKQPDHAMSDAELFWVIKNGIRMTGMPAWGPTHGDAEIWDIVAFLKALPSIDAAEYKKFNEQTAQGHGHSGADSQGHKAGHGSESNAGHAATETHHGMQKQVEQLNKESRGH